MKKSLAAGQRKAGFWRLLSGSLRVKIVAWVFVPTGIILVVMAVVNFHSY